MQNDSNIEELLDKYREKFLEYYNKKCYQITTIASALGIPLKDAKRLREELKDKLISQDEYKKQRIQYITEAVQNAIKEGKSLDELKAEISPSAEEMQIYNNTIEEIYKEHIEPLYKAALTIDQIAGELKISADFVKIIFQRLEYIKYYNKGYNQREIARELKISPEDCRLIIHRLSSYTEKVSEKDHRDNRREHIIDTVIKGKKEQASYLDLLSELCIESTEEKRTFYRILRDYYKEEYINVSEDEKKSKPSKPKTTVKKGKSSKRKEKKQKNQQEEQKKNEELKQKLEEDKQNSSNAVYKFFLNRIQTGEKIPENIDDLNVEFIAKSKIRKSKSSIQLIVDNANGITEKEKAKEKEPKITVIRFLKYNDPEYKTIVQETYKHVQELLTTFEEFKGNNKENTHLTLADSINNMSLQDRFFVTINLKLWLNKVKLESLETVQLKAIKDIIDRLPKQNKSLDSKGDDKNRIKISDTFKTIENMLSEFSTKILKVIEERNNLIR